jgi:hypothetical protein
MKSIYQCPCVTIYYLPSFKHNIVSCFYISFFKDMTAYLAKSVKCKRQSELFLTAFILAGGLALPEISYQYHIYLFYLVLNMNTATGSCIHIHKSAPLFMEFGMQALLHNQNRHSL